MITEELARHLDAASSDEDVVLIQHDGTGSESQWVAVWRDDAEARRWDAQDGEHWFADPNSDPMGLWQHVKYAKSARLVRTGEQHRPASAWSLPEWTIVASGTLAYVKLSDAYAVGDGAWQPTGPGPLVGNATIDDLLSDGCVKILRVGMGGAE